MAPHTFVGRTEDLAALEAARSRAAAGPGEATTVLLGGNAGVGKSRLVSELGLRAHAAGATTATGVCVPGDGTLPYGPVVGLLRDLTRQLDDATGADALGPLLSGAGLTIAGLSATADYRAGLRLVDAQPRTVFFESVLAFITGLARTTPLVLVVEDVHWADAASAELLDFLTRNLRDARVLLIATYRDDELTREHPLRAWLTELGRHTRVQRLHLGGLDRAALTTFIAHRTGAHPEPLRVETIWTRSQGNPFFAEQLIAAGGTALPAELRDVILTRVDRMSEGARQLLRLACAFSGTIDHGLLVDLEVLGADELDRAVGETVDGQVLRVTDSGQGYLFCHALLQEAVYGALLPGERMKAHRRIATVLTGAGCSDPAQLAAHWWAAGEWASAFGPSIAAADASIALLAFPAALTHLEHALTALERMPADVVPPGFDQVDLLERTAGIAYLASEGQRSVQLARAAVAGTDPTTEPRASARRHALLARNAWLISDAPTALSAYDEALALLSEDEPSTELAVVLAEHARGFLRQSRFAESIERCTQAIAVAQAVGARATVGNATNTLGCAVSALGRVDEAIALLRDALLIAQEVQDADDLNRAFSNLSILLMEAGRLEEAADLVFLHAESGNHWGAWLNGAACMSAESLVRLGRYDEAQELLDRVGANPLGVCAHTPFIIPAVIEVARGRFQEADRLLVAADAAVLEEARTEVVLVQVNRALESGRPAEALEHVRRGLTLKGIEDDVYGIAPLCSGGLRAIADSLEQARTSGQLDDPLAAAEELWSELERITAVLARFGSELTLLDRAHAATGAAERSRLDHSDPELWLAAAQRWEELKDALPAAYCRWREAEALLTGRASRARAIDSLARAWQTATALDARPLLSRIDGLAARARIELRAPEPVKRPVSAGLGLTSREVEVLGHLTRGLTDREIAEALFISPRTANAHVANLLRKLDVTNRIEAARIGQVHGLGIAVA